MIRKKLRPYYFRWFVLPKVELLQRRMVKKIRQKGYANVVFFAANLAMWRYQGIYELMRMDKRFNVTIILTPLSTFSEPQKVENIAALRAYFDAKGIAYEDATRWDEEKYKIRKWLDPDIMFYTQPYASIYGNALDYGLFMDKLLCYVPYGVGSMADNWFLNSFFQNRAWRLYFETEAYRDVARQHTFNKGRNIVVAGNMNADFFLKPDHHYGWKPQEHAKKKVIWAPHFSVGEKQRLHRVGFLWLYDEMLRIAEEYSDKVQFVFKPHPRLRSVLNDHPEWGRERTDAYFKKWDEMSNTQYEDSSFVDLFMTSDALIHDSGSFTVEYHYSQKPCLFTTQNLEKARLPLNEFGRAALSAHYIAKTVDDVRDFIDKMVLAGIDPMQPERQAFFQKYLLPPNGKSAAQNIYDNIVSSLWG